MAALRLIVGLGNPGAEYLRTRHNAGFWFLDALGLRERARFGNDAKVHGETAKIVLDGQPLWLLKPSTFVNKSGIAVAAALRYWKIEPEETGRRKGSETVREPPVPAAFPWTRRLLTSRDW